jgi:hypothetical protein
MELTAPSIVGGSWHPETVTRIVRRTAIIIAGARFLVRADKAASHLLRSLRRYPTSLVWRGAGMACGVDARSAAVSVHPADTRTGLLHSAKLIDPTGRIAPDPLSQALRRQPYARGSRSVANRPKMHIQIREGLTSAVHEDVRSGIADFGIGNAIDLAEGVIAESIVHESCYVVMPKRHRLGALSFVSFKDIGDEPLISMPSDSGLRRTLDVAASDCGVIFNHSIITNQFSSLFDFVSRGLGIAIVPASAVPPSSGSSITVKPLRPAMTRRIGILRLAERSLMPASQAFLKIFQPKFLAATSQRARRR